MSEIRAIQEMCSQLMKELLLRGIWVPEVSFSIRSDEEPHFAVRYWTADPSSDEVKNHPRSWGFIKHQYQKVDKGDVAAAFNAMVVKVRAIPSRAERQRDMFLGLLSKATEYGRQVGIDDEFVNPLSVLAKKLSENAITGPK